MKMATHMCTYTPSSRWPILEPISSPGLALSSVINCLVLLAFIAKAGQTTLRKLASTTYLRSSLLCQGQWKLLNNSTEIQP